MNYGKILAWIIACTASVMHFFEAWSDEKATYNIVAAIFIWLISSDL